MSDSDEDDVYSLTVTVRTVWDFHAGVCNKRQLQLDDRKTVSELLQLLASSSGNSKPADLFLLARANQARKDCQALDNKPLTKNSRLSTCNLQPGDHLDDCANPELVAVLSVIYDELSYAHGRFRHADAGMTCPVCGLGTQWDDSKPGLHKWKYCADPNCGFPAVVNPQDPANQVHVDAATLRVLVANKAHKETTLMESLVPARLTTEADADRLTRVAKGYLEEGMNRRNKTFVPPPILFLLKKYLRELAALHTCADPIAELVARHDPAKTMAHAASLPDPKEAGGSVERKKAGSKGVRDMSSTAVGEMRVELEAALRDEGLYSFQPRQGQRFRFPGNRVLEVGVDVKDRLLEIKIGLGREEKDGKHLDVRTVLDGSGGGSTVRMLGGMTQIELLRDVPATELKEARVREERGGVGFARGERLWVRVDKLDAKKLCVPGAHQLWAGR